MSLVEVGLTLYIAALAMPGYWLQFHTLRKQGTSEGLSVTYIAMGAASCATWLTYGIATGEAVQIAVNASAVVALILSLILMIRFDPRLSPVAFAVVVYILAITTVGLSFGHDVPGTVGIGIGFICRLPQVYKSWREPGGIAVSVPSFAVVTLYTFGWLVFGLVHHDAFMLISSISTISMSLYIVARTVRVNRGVVVPATA